MTFWYNISTGQVEQDGDTRAKDGLMGPYETREQAEAALQTARERTERWDQQDRAWDEGADAPDATP